MAFIFILSLTAFYAEVSILPLTQCSAMRAKKTDGCSECKMMHAKDMCKNAGKKSDDPCNKNASCFSCPLCSVFLPYNFSQPQTVSAIHKTCYFLYADDIISAYISETWKPPNSC